MKIAVCGKGGVGKTTICGLLCRLLSKKGYQVLAIDGDPNPNLSFVLGMDVKEQVPPALSSGMLEKVESESGKTTIQLKDPLDKILSDYAVTASDKIKLLTVGQPDHAGTGCMCSSHATVREIVHAALTEEKHVTILDMEASMEHMKRGTAKYVDRMYTVVEPYYRSLEAAGRYYELGKELGVQQIGAIANKIRSKQEEDAIREYCNQIGLPLVAVIPFDSNIAEADLKGKYILDEAGDSEAVRGVQQLVDQLSEPKKAE